MKEMILTVAACVVLLLVSTAQAATDEEKCLAGRAKAAAKYHGCVQTWLSKLYGGGEFGMSDQEKIAKCRIKYARVWTKLQGLSGSATCGGQPRYVDNGNGTITDNLTGLVWEKKSDNGDEHDKDNVESWSTGTPYNGNGTAFTTFLRDGLNVGAGFGGANDWRLPTFAELQTILLPEPAFLCTTSPCVDAAFNTNCAAACTVLTCSCTQSNFYWSATTYAGFPGYAWYVSFNGGFVNFSVKTSNYYARAVRGGL